jgi:hypothetical protein
MIFTPSAGPLGAHPVNYTTKCVVRTATVAVGDVVATSFLHGSAVIDPSLGYDPLYVFNCVAPADGDLTNFNGYIGVVTDLVGTSGAVGSTVTVQFGGIVTAKVIASGALTIGALLEPGDTAGSFVDVGGTGTGPNAAAVLMEAVAGAATVQRRVFIPLQYWFRDQIA